MKPSLPENFSISVSVSRLEKGGHVEYLGLHTWQSNYFWFYLHVVDANESKSACHNVTSLGLTTSKSEASTLQIMHLLVSLNVLILLAFTTDSLFGLSSLESMISMSVQLILYLYLLFLQSLW
jgi:hypothetical protein